MVVKTCVICGKGYEAYRDSQKACSPECRKKYLSMQATIAARERRNQANSSKKKSKSSIEEICKLARGNHMSYGEFVGQMYSMRDRKVGTK